MAVGDVVVFNVALERALENWAGADVMKCALVTVAVTPTQADATVTLATYTQCAQVGSYTTGGVSLGTWANFVTFSGAVTKFDSATDPNWAQHASGPSTPRWGILYNDTDASDNAFAFVDLGSTINLANGALTITWNASGIATITNS